MTQFQNYILNAMDSFLLASPWAVIEIAMRNSVKSICPELSKSNTLKTWLQNLSAFPWG